MSSDAAIKAEGLAKCYHIYDKPRDRLLQMLARGRRQYYREFWALRDISFEVGRGETIGIIGQNGSGKSTLLQLLCGTLTPTAGAVSVQGRIAALLELGAGFNPEFSGKENVFLNAAVLGLNNAEMRRLLPEIEAFAEIGDFIDQPVKTYSSGMYVRLAFAVAIHVSPQILIVDEALAVGDVRFQAKCMNRIKQMKEAGVSILFVSHDVGSVRTLCDRVLWLDGGQIRMQGEVFPVTAQFTEYMFSDSGQVAVTPGPQNENMAEPGGDREMGAATPEPVNHWGTHMGAILAAGIHDAQGVRRDVFMDDEDMTIVILFQVPPKADREHLSVAFSIKDIRGDDLIVAATADDAAINFTGEADLYEIRFRMKNCLNTGKYILVAALEDRSSAAIQYYEYIEGAQYFSTLINAKRFGRFTPAIQQSAVQGVYA